MHMALRSFLVAIVAGLAFTAIAPAALADTATETLVLARDGCGGSDDNQNPVTDDATRLDWSTGTSTFGCGNALGARDAVTGPSAGTDYPTAKDVGSVTLDGTRPIVVDIDDTSYFAPFPVGSVGDETVSIILTGVNATTHKRVTLGSASQTTPAQDQVRKSDSIDEFTLAPTAAQGATFSSLTLNVYAGGSALGGFITNNGSSLITLPIPGDVDAQPPA